MLKINHVVKRDGTKQNFDSSKIINAIYKALCEYEDKEKAIMLAQVVSKNILNILSINEKKEIEIEELQDIVEKQLMSFHQDAAKAYILYRAKRNEERNMDIEQIIKDYIGNNDWRVNENSNIGHSYSGLILHIAGTGQAKFTLQKYPKYIRQAHNQGYMHIHDLSFGLAGYCAGWSLRDLLLMGFNAGVVCAPPKHFDSVLGQIVNFLGTLQNEWAGAQAFNNIDTYLAPFIRIDQLNYKQVKQAMQKFIFNLNVTSRWGGQSPFTNITLDVKCPKHIANEPIIVGGQYLDTTYGEYQKEMDMFNKAFLEVMLDGDFQNRIFSFPIPTYNITKDFPWDSENGKLLLKMTAKYGIPYFQNFINSDLNPEDVRSMCCRLQMNLSEIKNKTGGLFGAGDLTGSIGVVTLNLPRIAYISKGDKNTFFALLKQYADYAKESLEIKRKLVQVLFENGLFPTSKKYLKNGFNGHFSTIGIVGGNEACINLLGKDYDITSEQGILLMEEMLFMLRDLVKGYQEETGNLYNLEATPAEGTSYRLAKIDKKEFSNIISSGYKEPFYTNSTQLPVDKIGDIFYALEHQNRLQTLYTGGTVFHTFLGEQVDDIEALKNFIIKAFQMTKLPYLSITPSFSICENHGYIRGEQEICPECNSETEVYTRIVGYYRPVVKWNIGKKEEYQHRRMFKI